MLSVKVKGLYAIEECNKCFRLVVYNTDLSTIFRDLVMVLFVVMMV
jgi:hypothetical protein